MSKADKRASVNMMSHETQPAITGSEDGREPGAEEYRPPLEEAGKGKEIDSILELPEGMQSH